MGGCFMKIEYFGHSCFRLTDDKRSVVFDPFGDIGYRQPKLKADYCVCTHKHYDHYATDYVDCKEVITGENADRFDFLSAISSWHDDCRGKKRGKNTIFIYHAEDGTIFCHMGDIGEPIPDPVCKLADVDVLAIPVGGNYTIGAREAKKYCDLIAPKLIIPMHYKTARSNIDIAPKSEFLSLYGKYKIVKANRSLTIKGGCTDTGLYGKIVDFNDDEF